MRPQIVLQIITLGLLILAALIDTLSLPESENICRISWQNLETILKMYTLLIFENVFHQLIEEN